VKAIAAGGRLCPGPLPLKPAKDEMASLASSVQGAEAESRSDGGPEQSLGLSGRAAKLVGGACRGETPLEEFGSQSAFGARSP